MYLDDIFFDDEFAGPVEDFDRFVCEFRDRFGEYRCGRIEDDPSWNEYEETLELGLALAGS